MEKEAYLSLFNSIKTIFDENGFTPNFKDFPEEITKVFEIHFELQWIEKLYQPNFIFEITHKKTKKYLKMIIASASILSLSRFSDFREQIISENFSGIVMTKRNLFKSTSTALTIIFFNEFTNKKFFSSVDNTEEIYSVLFDQDHHCRKIFYPTEIDNNNLLPEHYNPTNRKIYNLIDEFSPRKLEDIAEIIPGANANQFCFTDSNEEPGIPYLRARCLQNGQILPDEKRIKKDLYSNYARQLLRPGDILITKFFGQNKIVQVQENNLPAIASSMLVIIRPFEELNFDLYEYLSTGIGSEIFKKQLQDISSGNTVASFSMKDLRNLQIPSIKNNNFSDFESTFDKKFYDLQKMTLEYLNTNSEEDICKLIKSELLDQGWNAKDIEVEKTINSIRLDIVLMDKEEPIAFFELKKPSHYEKESVKVQLLNIQKSLKIPGILTLGSYYEVYYFIQDSLKIRKFFAAPTKKEILSIIKEDM